MQKSVKLLSSSFFLLSRKARFIQIRDLYNFSLKMFKAPFIAFEKFLVKPLITNTSEEFFQ